MLIVTNVDPVSKIAVADRDSFFEIHEQFVIVEEVE